MSIGDRIKVHRRRMGFAQEKLAKRVYVSRSAIGNYEIGTRIPNDNVLYLLSGVFEVSSEYLKYGKMTPYEERLERLIAMEFKIDVSGLTMEHRVLVLRFFDSLVQREQDIESQKKESF